MRQKYLYIVCLLLVAGHAAGETLITSTCEQQRRKLGYPHYYCYCKEESETFAFPQDRIVNDTMWFEASVNDLRQGMTAYWFADCAVTMDVYALCSSKAPTMSFTVGANSMTDKSVDEINEKLDELGDLAGIISLFTAHIRVYPHQNGSGHVYCYPYDQGPHSTCESLLPVRTTMTYVSNHEDDVYELEPQTIPSSGQLFIQWKERKNRPCQMEIAGTCDGEALYSTTLSDSVRVCLIDSTLLLAKKAANEPLYIRFIHDSTHVGRIRFTPDPRYISVVRDSAVCEGKATDVNEEEVIVTDTTWVTGRTLAQNGYRLYIAPPDTLHDTVSLGRFALEAGYYYMKADTMIYDTGDYIFRIEGPGTCTYIIRLTVEEILETSIQSADTRTDGKATLHYDPQKGIYIQRAGRRYTLLGQPINNK